jgi:hypothetical protein
MKDTKRGKRKMNGLEQVGMGTEAVEIYIIFVKAVDHEQIPFHMTFGIAIIVAGKQMLPVTGRQRLAVQDEVNDRTNGVHIPMAFCHQLVFPLEPVGKIRCTHPLIFQCFPELFTGFVPLDGDFPPPNSVALREGGQGFGVGDMRFAAYRANVPVNPECFYRFVRTGRSAYGNRWPVFYVTHKEPPVLSIGEMAA